MNLSPIDIARLEYTELLEREIKAEEYLNHPFRTPEEIKKWNPKYSDIMKRLEYLLSTIGSYKPDNIRFGWPELLAEQNREKRNEETENDILNNTQTDLGY